MKFNKEQLKLIKRALKYYISGELIVSKNDVKIINRILNEKEKA